MKCRKAIPFAMALAPLLVAFDSRSCTAQDAVSFNQVLAKISPAGTSSDWWRDAQNTRAFRRVRITKKASLELGFPIEFLADRRENFCLFGLRDTESLPVVFRYSVGNRNLDLAFDDIVFDRYYSLDHFDTFSTLERKVEEVAKFGGETARMRSALKELKSNREQMGWIVDKVPDSELNHFLRVSGRSGTETIQDPSEYEQ